MDIDAIIRDLGLRPHPEGGFYRETFRDPLRLTLPDGRIRSASTAIHYLLPAGGFSAFHRVRAAEVWHRYAGGPLILHLLGAGSFRLDEASPQKVVPAGAWQAAEAPAGAVLCGCTVAPGFEFEDFELGRAGELVKDYPGEAELIRRLCRA